MTSQAPGPQSRPPGLFAEIEADLLRAEMAIEAALRTSDPLLAEVSTHLLRAGGKRLRPALVVTSARLFSDDGPMVMPIAAAVELIHMATLVHDDIVDRSSVRRGMPTVNARWGASTGVLMGDYLFARAFSLLAEQNRPAIVRIMADVVFEMSRGEIEQQQALFDLSLGEAAYWQRLRRKTALFIAESCRLGGMAGGASDQQAEALHHYGLNLGCAFQVIDDLLDFVASPAQLGKPVGSDLRSGLFTLPVLHALEHSPRRDRLRSLLSNQRLGDDEVRQVVHLCQESGSFDHARVQARHYHARSLEALLSLPPTPARDTLAKLADFVVNRDH